MTSCPQWFGVLAVPGGRDGAEKSYFVCQTMRGCRSAALLDFPPGANLPKGDECGFQGLFYKP